jgi:hypothetical protein
VHTREVLISIRKSFADELERLDQPAPGPLWQYSHWVITMQTVIELDRIIDELASKDTEHLLGQVKKTF